MRVAVAALVLLLLGGCYQPDLTAPGAPRYLCGAAGECPDGLRCGAGLCLKPGETVPDLGASAPSDAAAGGGVAACASGRGFVLDATAAACPAIFGAGKAAGACAAGHHPCTALSQAALQACAAVGSGFFVASATPAAKPGAGPARCGAAGSHTFLLGCGGRQAAVEQVEGCEPWPLGLDCFFQGAVGWLWDCDGQAGLYQAAYQGQPGTKAPLDGVLCCT